MFVVDGLDNPTEVTLLVAELREDGIRAERTYGGRAFRKQMDAANKSGRPLHRRARASRRPSGARSR